MKKNIEVGSFFAGIGGICLGFEKANHPFLKYNLNWANEIDSYACETYRNNFKHDLLEGDINYVLFPEESDNFIYYNNLKKIMFKDPIDILNGGFPCQAFSIAGEQRGFKDERGNLFLSFINFIKIHKKIFNKIPRILFLENVKNLKSHDKGRTYRVIKSELEKVGYIVKEEILNTMEYSDLPQNRERIYIIGFSSEKDAQKFDMFDRLEDYKINKKSYDRINDIKKIINYSENNEKYFYTKYKYPHYFINENEYDKLKEKKKYRINLEEEINEFFQFYQLRRGQYVRKNQSGVCPTLTANMGTGGHNVPLILTEFGIRKLTPYETFKLQGFPIGFGYELPKQYKGRRYPDGQLYKQAGNAVSVPIIQLLAEELFNIFEDNIK